MDCSHIPSHMRAAVIRYVESGIPPGSFLTALFANDFLGAAMRADEINLQALPQWARFIYNEMPAGSHGSYEAVDMWCARNVLDGPSDPPEKG